MVKETIDCKCDAKDIEENKGLAAISYLWLLCLIPLFGKKDSAFAQFHAKQGLGLLVLWVLCGFIMVVPVLGWFIGAMGYVVSFVLVIIGISNVFASKCVELPIVGKWFKNVKF
ncbi:MAG: putative membrane protein [uncultured bacterium]|nr:MAG: putative membrane protein [uncultured bacterium]